MAAERLSPPVPKAIGGVIFVLFWAIAIVAWSLSGLAHQVGVRGFIVDIGVIFMAAGTSSVLVRYRLSYVWIMVLSLIGTVIVGFADLYQVHLFVYFVRIAAIALAFGILPILKLVNGLRVFA